MKIAIIGAWHVHTKQYAEIIQNNPLSELVCLWDNDISRGEEMAKELGIPFESDIEKIWNDKEIDSVQITTATTDHKDILIGTARAGKNIFTEKVLALTNEDAKEIADEIIKSKIKFTISYPHKSWPTLIKAKELVDSGKLGTITYGRVRDVHDGSTAGWLPDYFYDKSQTGGGAMIDLGAHPMYTLNWFLGEAKNIVSTFTDVTGRGVEDNAVSVIEFQNGAIGVSETGFVSTGIKYVLEMSGTEGALMVRGDVLDYACKETDGKLVQCTDLPPEGLHPLDAWIEAVVMDKEAPNGIEESLALTKLMVGAYDAFQKSETYKF